MVSARRFRQLEMRVDALEGKRATTLEEKNLDKSSEATSIIVLAHEVLSYARDIYTQRKNIAKQDLDQIREMLEQIVDQFNLTLQ